MGQEATARRSGGAADSVPARAQVPPRPASRLLAREPAPVLAPARAFFQRPRSPAAPALSGSSNTALPLPPTTHYQKPLAQSPSLWYSDFAFVALVSPLGSKAVARSHLRPFFCSVDRFAVFSNEA